MPFVVDYFTLPLTLPLTLWVFYYYFLVKVGNSGSTTSFKTAYGKLQKKIAPSLPTETIVFWSGDSFSLVIDPECPYPS